MRNPFRDPYVTWRSDASGPWAEDAAPGDPLRVVWGMRTTTRGESVGNPVKVYDPDFVHERIDLPTVTIFGKKFVPINLAINSMIIGEALLIGALIGSWL